MRIHHLALRTDDVGALERFYVGVLGLHVTRRFQADDGERVWLDAAGSLLMLEPRGATEPRLPAGSLELVAFAIAPEDHARIAARLAEASVAVEARTGSTLYLRDPDGRRVGLSCYPDELA